MDMDGWTDGRGRTTKGKEQNEMGDRPRTITFKAKIDLRTILDAHRIMLALKGAILSVTPPSGRLGMKTCACGSAGAGWDGRGIEKRAKKTSEDSERRRRRGEKEGKATGCDNGSGRLDVDAIACPSFYRSAVLTTYLQYKTLHSTRSPGLYG